MNTHVLQVKTLAILPVLVPWMEQVRTKNGLRWPRWHGLIMRGSAVSGTLFDDKEHSFHLLSVDTSRFHVSTLHRWSMLVFYRGTFQRTVFWGFSSGG